VPQSARHGLTWYEIDMNWYGICVLRALGLAKDVKRHKLAPSADEAGARKPAVALPPHQAAAPVPVSSGD
jgi:hypothetical protein